MKLFTALRSFLSLLFFVYDLATKKYARSVVILCYHSFANSNNRYAVNLEVFKKQVRRIQKFADFVRINDLKVPAKNGRAKVALTIDDGLSSVMDILPFTQANNIPVSLFILANPEKANRAELDTDEKFLTWTQIKQLHKAGWTIGCHSSTHSDFSKLSNDEIVKEIIDSKKVLETKLGFSIDSIAYPKGSYSNKIIKAVGRAGYKYGFTIEAGVIDQDSKSFELPRTIIDSTHSVPDLPSILTPSWLKFRDLTNRFKLWERFLS